MNVLAVGTLAFDSVETPFGARRDVLGGSVSYVAIAAAYFCPVRVVGVVGKDFPSHYLDFLRSRGVDTSGVSVLEGKTFRWSGRYSENLNERETLETQLNVLAEFRPELPASFRDSELVVLGNIDPELQIRVLDQVHRPRLVACDTMNYWIEAPQYRGKLEQALKRVDILSINDSEARLLAGEYNLVKAAALVRRMGPKSLVVKRGEHGALLFSQDGIFAAPAFPLEEVRDPTGAGDAFAGGMIGLLAKKGATHLGALKQAVVMGTVLASFAVEDFSLDRFRTLTPRDISARFRAYQLLTSFEADGAELWIQP
jgi:sugar/nucleoside kinase (ribokinase family)